MHSKLLLSLYFTALSGISVQAYGGCPSTLPSYGAACEGSCGCLATTGLVCTEIPSTERCTPPKGQCACPEGQNWDAGSGRCKAESDTSGVVCFETYDMLCRSGCLSYASSNVTWSNGSCGKGYCPFPNPKRQPYVNVRAMYKDLTPTGVTVKHLHVGNNPSSWGFTLDLRQPNQWSDWKKIQLYGGPETGYRGTPWWLAFIGAQAPAIGGFCMPNLTKECSAGSSTTAFHATVCVEYKFEGDPII